MTTIRLPLRFFLVFLLCFLFASSFSLVFGLAGCRPDQIEAIMQFKNEFGSSGCNQTDFFNGFLCHNTTGVVTELQLPSDCLSGILKPNSSLFGLHHLRYLNISHNNFFSSSLPSQFGNLNKLEVLSLSSNGFIGQVPSSFSNLTSLSFLDLSHNYLTGSFPLVRNLSKLNVLELSYNHFSGTLSSKSSLFDLHQLRYLNLGNNNFTSSSISSEFGNLNKLEALSLSSNGFIGKVPSSFSNLSRLTELHLSQNAFTGSFPLVHNLTNLSILSLSHNLFSGAIPSSLFTLPFLSFLDLQVNHFTSSIEVPNSSSSSRLNCKIINGVIYINN